MNQPQTKQHQIKDSANYVVYNVGNEYTDTFDNIYYRQQIGNISIMSTWKAQQMRSFPVLIQFSTIPLVRKAIKTLTHYQLRIIGFVFLATLALVIRKDAPWVMIDKQVAIQFFSAVSQSLAALLGVLIIFLTFNTQLITQRRYEDYHSLQLQIDKLIHLAQSLPSELNNFTQTPFVTS